MTDTPRSSRAPAPGAPSDDDLGGMVIRLARRDDVAGIIALFLDDDVGQHGDRLDARTLPNYLAAFDDISRTPTERLFVAEVAGRVIGTFQMTFCRTLVHHARLRAMIEAVHVASSCRGQGVGAAMMTRALAVARDAGAGVVELTSNKRRTAAHRFYERLGFHRTHEGFKFDLTEPDAG